MEKIWLKQYPAGVPAEVRADLYPSLVALLENSFSQYRERPACRCMGRDLGYGQLDEHSRALAAWLQGRGLVRGDRVAVMLPNLPQYLVAVAAILRAGLVVVNVSPQHMPRELEYQLKDAGAKAIVIIEDAAATLQQVLERVPVPHVLLTGAGDMLGPLKGPLVNHMARRVRKLVPSFHLPGATRFLDALARGRRMALQPAAVGPDDIALLQYTGGTTGPCKGAVLLHRNLVANLLQSRAWYGPALARIPAGEQPVTVCALPLHHIYGFNVIMMLGLLTGGCSLLIPNPRDTAALLKELARQRFHSFPAVDTLFDTLLQHPDFDRVDWSHLRLSIGGAMAVQQATARAWLERTACPICEGYGLSEASPSVSCNPVDTTDWSGHIGLPLPGTEVTLLDDEGRPVPPGTPGELAVRGPQVMAGYWQRPDETARVITPEGWLRSGDIAVVDSRGNFRIVDRKKDLIFVSGFNVYPGEVEDVLTQMPGVQECAVIGIPDARAGEAVKVVVVRQAPTTARPTEADVRAWCEANLTGYKRPKVVEFRADLPKSPAGKVLRRALRDHV
ncbi:MAG: AMP-binding protein [Rubrivivax sp.]|nr:AMP-binding protein [Rubrivivax sp.]